VIAFAAPVWLAALGALALPLAIHLWSHRARRPIRVGSIRLLSGMAPATRHAVRLRDPWLLALRLAMLAALALSLADPYWAPRSPRARTWALLSTEALADRTLIDSLRDTGAELRLLEDGSGQMADGSSRPASEPLPSAISHLPNYWSLLAEADRMAPAGTRFLVAAPLVADRFRGLRPAISAPVTWREVGADVPRGAPPAAAPPRRVAILADAAHRDDARYLEAAIRAAAQTTGLPADVTRGSPADAAALAPEADWIVWPATAGASPAAAGLVAPVWSDPHGAPRLSVARDGRTLVFRLHARITPEWALAPEFIEAVAALWAEPVARAAVAAPRITPAQATPATVAALPRRAAPAGAVPLAVPLWVLAALALAVDRGLALRRRRGSV
jgi:hypothetical protein